MARKTNLVHVSQAWLGSGVLLTITGFIIHYAYMGHLIWPLAVGFGLPSLAGGIGLAVRLGELTGASNSGRPATGRRGITFSSGGHTKEIMLSLVPWHINHLEQDPTPPKPFEFWESEMTAVIPDNQLLTFCRTAWRRQQQTRFGNLAANQVFSRLYFTGQARPRYSPADYKNIMHILLSRNLIRGRWQGKGGELRYTPTITVAEAQRRW